MSYSSRAFEDSCEFLGLELGSETALDLCQEYTEQGQPIPAWLVATWAVRLAKGGGCRGTDYRDEWERGEHPIDPADVETASRAFCVWPAWDSHVSKSLPKYCRMWWEDASLIAPDWLQDYRDRTGAEWCDNRKEPSQ